MMPVRMPGERGRQHHAQDRLPLRHAERVRRLAQLVRDELSISSVVRTMTGIIRITRASDASQPGDRPPNVEDEQRVDEQRRHDRRDAGEDVDHERRRAEPAAAVLDEVDAGQHGDRHRDQRAQQYLLGGASIPSTAVSSRRICLARRPSESTGGNRSCWAAAAPARAGRPGPLPRPRRRPGRRYPCKLRASRTWRSGTRRARCLRAAPRNSERTAASEFQPAHPASMPARSRSAVCRCSTTGKPRRRRCRSEPVLGYSWRRPRQGKVQR